MTSDVSTGSARISLLLLLKVFFWSKAVPVRSRPQNNLRVRIGSESRVEGKSPACEKGK
jgi:hypothetical protein